MLHRFTKGWMVEGENVQATHKEYTTHREEFVGGGFLAQNGFWHIAKENLLEDNVEVSLTRSRSTGPGKRMKFMRRSVWMHGKKNKPRDRKKVEVCRNQWQDVDNFAEEPNNLKNIFLRSQKRRRQDDVSESELVFFSPWERGLQGQIAAVRLGRMESACRRWEVVGQSFRQGNGDTHGKKCEDHDSS